MKKAVLTLCSLAMFPLCAGEDDWSLNNSFAFWVDAVAYRRAETHQHDLVLDQTQGHLDSCGLCHLEGCTARHLTKKFDYEPGFRLGMSFMGERSAWELSYLWVSDWRHCCEMNNPGNVFFSQRNPFYLNDYAFADKGEACYQSWFQNTEINYFRYVTPHRGNRFSVGWMAGMRFIYLAEHLGVGFTKGTSHSSYEIDTWNYIPAGQLGAIFSVNPMKTLFWDIVAKVGMGFDIDLQHTKLGDFNNSVTIRDYDKWGFATPLIADVSVTLTYQPWKFFNIHTAYEMIYLNGVALAPDQLVKHGSDEQVIRSIGMPIYHGWTLGLTFSF